MQDTWIVPEEQTHSATYKCRKQHNIKVTRHNIPEDTKINTQHRDNLKSHTRNKLKFLVAIG
jgi:hypothetical protein